jgi:sulfoxide reductase heme-binding subunit YedZ
MKFAQLIKLRKTFGVYSAIYALAHLFTYIAFELQYEWALVLSEIIKRPYITVGFLGLSILTLMLMTSFNTVQRKMGKYWGKLHRWVYLALILIALHFVWSIKSQEIEPYFYIALSALLLYLRKEKIKRIFK